jgi:hypothetical protein
MDLYKYQDYLIGKLESQLFLWDSNWECFRPITNIGWDNNKITFDDYKFKNDLFSLTYGFGEFKELCQKLSLEIDLTCYKIINDISLLTNSNYLIHFKDRKIPFLNECSLKSKNTISWLKYLKYLNLRQKTLRRFHNNINNRVTKRLLRK